MCSSKKQRYRKVEERTRILGDKINFKLLELEKWLKIETLKVKTFSFPFKLSSVQHVSP